MSKALYFFVGITIGFFYGVWCSQATYADNY